MLLKILILSLFLISETRKTIQKNNVFKNYLQKQCEKHKYEVIDLSENGEYSSCILTDDKIYLSGISALTLKKRAEDDFGIEVYNRDRDN